jgi:hypothetical protein
MKEAQGTADEVLRGRYLDYLESVRHDSTPPLTTFADWVQTEGSLDDGGKPGKRGFFDADSEPSQLKRGRPVTFPGDCGELDAAWWDGYNAGLYDAVLEAKGDTAG